MAILNEKFCLAVSERTKSQRTNYFYICAFFGAIIFFSVRMLAAPHILYVNNNESGMQQAYLAVMQMVHQRPDLEMVYFGEDHRNLEGKVLVEQIAANLARRYGFNCHFVEEPVTHNKAFSYLSVDNALARQLFFERWRRYKKMFAADYEFSPQLWTNIDALTRLSNSGLQIIPVDKYDSVENIKTMASAYKAYHAPHSTEKDYILYYRRFLHETNQVMASNIHQAFASGRCNKGVFVVGSGHIVIHTRIGDMNIIPVPMQVQRPNIKVKIEQCSKKYTPDRACEAAEYADLNIFINMDI